MPWKTCEPDLSPVSLRQTNPVNPKSKIRTLLLALQHLETICSMRLFKISLEAGSKVKHSSCKLGPGRLQFYIFCDMKLPIRTKHKYHIKYIPNKEARANEHVLRLSWSCASSSVIISAPYPRSSRKQPRGLNPSEPWPSKCTLSNPMVWNPEH